MFRQRFRAWRLKRRFPNTVIEATVEIDRNVTIEPFVVLRGKTRIGSNTTIRSFSYITDSDIGPRCVIGPFAQINRSAIGYKVVAKHICYLGDAVIEDGVNIGAGVITANYDGETKKKTRIEEDAFIGVGAILIAPVTIGYEAGVAAGTVITDDVPSRALAIRRPREQTNVPNRVRRTTNGWLGLKKRQRPAP